MSKTGAVLEKCFRALPKRDRVRLRYHALKKTPICCGLAAALFTDGFGGG